MEQPLLTIGAFARAVGLAPSTLRFYDDCGLLPPAEVDESTGYRYYTPELARRAQAVAQMRDAGVSIEAMRAALDGTAEDRRRILREVLAEQEAMAARRASVLESLIADESAQRHAGAVTVDGPVLAAAIRQVRAAADVDPGSALAGVLLDVAAGAIDVVATNRYWMAVRTLPCPPSEEIRAVVSLSGANRLCELLDRHEEVVLDVAADRLRIAGHDLPVRPVAYPAHRILLAGLPPATIRLQLPSTDLLQAVDALGHAEFDLEVLTGGVRIGDREIPGVVDEPGLTVRLGSALVRRAVECALGPEVILRLASDVHAVRVGSPYQPGFLALVMPIARPEE